MNAQIRTRRRSSRARQRGQTMLLVVALILIIGVALFVQGTVGSRTLELERNKKTLETLAQVKQALIGWSASRTPTGASPNIRPGELPCPDVTNSGNDPGPTCSAGALGRVPWKSLGIPEPIDSSGETMWYAVSGPFRHYGPGNTSPITSDTLGNLTVYQGSSATTLSSQAIAVIFAAGAALGSQNRSPSTTAFCPTTGTTIASDLCAANYLEATGGGGNAQSGGPFIQAQPSDTFNDRLLVITNDDLMPIVEQRVAREMRSLLQGYRAATATSALYLGGIYPWADISNGNSDDGNNRGRFPCGTASPVGWNSLVPLSIPLTSTPPLPAWLTNGCGSNGWASVMYYSSGRNFLDILNLACSTCTFGYNQLRVYDTTGATYVWVDLVLLTPGAATGARTWTSGYFEDSENSDNNDDQYITPTSTAYNRDRLFSYP